METTKWSIGRLFRHLFGLIWRLDKAYFPALFGQSLATAAAGILMLYVPRILIDGLQQGWPADRFLRTIALIVAARYVLLQTAALAKRQEAVHSGLLQQQLPKAFSEKVMRLSYADLEDPEVLDLKERALFPVLHYTALQQMLDASVKVLTNAFTLAGVLTILLPFSLLFTGMLTLLSFGAILLSILSMRQMKEVTEAIIPVNRRFGYYVDTAMGADYQKDFRLFGLQSVMERKITGYLGQINDWMHRSNVRIANIETGQALVAAVMRFVTWSYIALRTAGTRFGPQISWGQFAVLVGAAEAFSTALATAVDAAYSFGQSLSYLEPYCRFMDRAESAEQSGGGKPEPLETLEFENVSFSYPKTDRLILNDISFSLRRGEKISVVGLNQAGKSTLIKLICRLFKPDSGRILWNGTDIQEFDYQAYMEQLSCVFQDFQLFPFTIRDNLQRREGESDESLRALLREVGMEKAIDRLPAGLDTGLEKSLFENATDFSGGQKQKLAIARAIHKQADLVILDEPTAALDPLAESEIYEQFHELTRGRTALFISHRMSSSLFCDRILLLQEGRVAAYDSHENLMRGHNLYRVLFETQAAHFVQSA